MTSLSHLVRAGAAETTAPPGCFLGKETPLELTQRSQPARWGALELESKAWAARGRRVCQPACLRSVCLSSIHLFIRPSIHPNLPFPSSFLVDPYSSTHPFHHSSISSIHGYLHLSLHPSSLTPFLLFIHLSIQACLLSSIHPFIPEQFPPSIPPSLFTHICPFLHLFVGPFPPLLEMDNSGSFSILPHSSPIMLPHFLPPLYLGPTAGQGGGGRWGCHPQHPTLLSPNLKSGANPSAPRLGHV